MEIWTIKKIIQTDRLKPKSTQDENLWDWSLPNDRFEGGEKNHK